MAKIICPNKQYDGVSASVTFTNGVGETDKPNLIAWFREHGYTVEECGKTEGGNGGGFEDMTAKELKAYADEKKIDLGKAKTKPEMIAAITKAEAEGGKTEPPKDDEAPDDSEDEGGEGQNE